MSADLAPQFSFEPSAPEHRRHFDSEELAIGRQRLRTTPVFNAYWQFAAERQRIFFRRIDGEKDAVTTDPVLRLYKFTNAYRASDRVSQYLIRNVQYRDDLPSDSCNVFFRTLLFKLFNKIETWEFLEAKIGGITWEAFDFSRFDRLLTRRMTEGERIYSAAYIMPSGGSVFGYKLKHQNHLKVLEFLIENKFPQKLVECSTMAEAYALLRTVPSLGPFLAYQYVTDLNYSTLTDFSEDEFVMAGPGALDGIDKCFTSTKGASSSDVIRYMYENQNRHFNELGIDFPSLWGRPLQLIDCQNLFCEISKYARVAFPNHAGISGRTRIKQKFQSRGLFPRPWYPPKWKINTLAAS